MPTHRTIEISLGEAEKYVKTNKDGTESVITNSGGLVYRAGCQFGESFASDPETALRGARRLIDQNLR